MKQYAMVVEADRCIGCKGGCQVACKTENEVALGRSRSTLYHMGPTGVSGSADVLSAGNVPAV